MKALLLAYLLSSGADAGTTHYALNHGGHEVIWPTQNPWLIDGLTAGQAVGVTGLGIKLHRTHPRLAITMAVISVGIRGAVVASNIYQVRKYAH
jgi:hypothetical protein